MSGKANRSKASLPSSALPTNTKSPEKVPSRKCQPPSEYNPGSRTSHVGQSYLKHGKAAKSSVIKMDERAPSFNTDGEINKKQQSASARRRSKGTRLPPVTKFQPSSERNLTSEPVNGDTCPNFKKDERSSAKPPPAKQKLPGQRNLQHSPHGSLQNQTTSPDQANSGYVSVDPTITPREDLRKMLLSKNVERELGHGARPAESRSRQGKISYAAVVATSTSTGGTPQTEMINTANMNIGLPSLPLASPSANIPISASYEPYYKANTIEIRHENRNLLDLATNLRGPPLMVPAQIGQGPEFPFIDRSQFSYFCGWQPSPHTRVRCPDPDCQFEEEHEFS